MIKLEKFRLVNVHANNDTMVYPDVTLSLNGENTLIDAKNGGGKTLAIQMLFQTILPNSYFDENKTIRTLFYNTPPKTTMHTVASFLLEDDSNQYTTLCLGFAVSKSQELSNELNFFNYIIEGNDLDSFSLGVDTLKLNNGSSATSISDLKKLLHEKSSQGSQSYNITTFENRMDEYVQTLRQFDINPQVYRFIMNINQTENYIQQYFEKRCSSQQGLLTEFIIPNTVSALDDKKSSLQRGSEDDISILAQSLLEKSKSLSQLKNIETEVKEYDKIIALIDTFLFTVKNNRNDFVKYEKFLKEYSKQYANYSNLISTTKVSLDDATHSIEATQQSIDTLNDSIEYLITRKIECEVSSLQSQLQKSEQYYSQCQSDIKHLKGELNRMLATNSIVEYQTIENQLQLFETANSNGSMSAYANTIQSIASMQVKKTQYEMDYVKNHISELNALLIECIQNIGKLKNLSLTSRDNVKNLSEKLNDQLVNIETIQNEMAEFKRYGNSLLESDELFAIVDSIKDINSKLDDLKAKRNDLNLKVSVGQSSIGFLEQSIQECKNAIALDTDKKSLYEREVAFLKSELCVEEFEFENKYNEFKDRQVQINVEISNLNSEIHTAKDDISTMKQYGILRKQSRYEALKLLQTELDSAYFGSEMLQSINNIQLLERFPFLAEVIIVSDKDYNAIKGGKITFPDEVLKENFVIMPYNTIRNINKLTFSEMLCLTRDANYYQSIMDTKLKIEENNQKILSCKYQIEKLSAEYDSIQALCNKIITHVSMYSFDVVQGINARLQSNTQTLGELTTKFESTRDSLEVDKTTLEEYSNSIFILEEELSKAENKRYLLDELIKLMSESHKNQISITNENKKIQAYEVEINDLNLQLTSIQSKVATLQSDFEHQKSSISVYKGYLAEVENYVDDSIQPIYSKNLELLVQQFRAIKNGLNLGVSENVRPILLQLMENIKNREVFNSVPFDTLYQSTSILVPFDSTTIDQCNADLLSAEKLLRDQSNFILVQNNTLGATIGRFDERLNAEDSQYDDYRKYSLEDVQTLLDKSYADRNNLCEHLRTLTEHKLELERVYNDGLVQCELYKFFCVEKHLDLNLPCDNSKKVNFFDMNKKYNQLHSDYKSALNEVNTSIKKLSKGVDNLKISEQIKYTIKNNAIVKQNYSEVTAFADRLKHLKAQAEAMILNLNTTIENLGRIDEDISEQLYRILTEILDEVSSIPKISKCKFDDSYKETFKINLYVGGKGCRFPEDKIRKSIKKYILELATDISNKYYDKNQIIELLSINKIIRFGVDMDKLNIQILKIDQEKPIYQNWENVIASTGQEYIMYVMFTVTMVKYFNNIMGNSNKSPLFIFLDNPFASASDVQLWQPVRKFLDKNDTQLLCSAHNVPTVGQILFEKQIILEQSKDEHGRLINSIRNQKTEIKENTQLSLFDHLELD